MASFIFSFTFNGNVNSEIWADSDRLSPFPFYLTKSVTGSTSDQYVLSQFFEPKYSVNGTEYRIIPETMVNGEPCYVSADKDRYIYKSKDYGFIDAKLPLGVYPAEIQPLVTDKAKEWEMYEGDDFWVIGGSLPYRFSTDEQKLTPRGSNRRKDGKYEDSKIRKIKAVYPHYAKSITPAGVRQAKPCCGIYVPAKGYEKELQYKKITVGYPVYEVSQKNAGAAKYVMRSKNKINGYYEYGYIRFDPSAKKWIIGAYNTQPGWHESEKEPNMDEKVTFVFVKHKDFAKPDNWKKPEDIIVTFNALDTGHPDDILVTDIPVWR